MRRFIYLVIFSYISIIVSAQVNVESTINKTKIKIGEPIEWKIIAKSNNTAKVIYPLFNSSHILPNGVERLSQKVDTILNGNERQIIYIQRVIAWDAKQYKLPSQKIYINSKCYTTSPLTISVIDVKVNTSAKAKPADNIHSLPFDIIEWIPLILLFILAICLLFLSYYFYKKSKRANKSIKNKTLSKRLLPHEKALQEINRVKEQNKNTDRDEKQYYTELIDILRNYLSERFMINAMELTSEQIINQLKDEGDKAKITELQHVFKTADLVKFAKYSTIETERNYSMLNVVQYIEDTKSMEQPVTNSEPNIDNLSQHINSKRHKLLVSVSCLLCVIGILLLAYVVYDIIILLS